MQKLADCIPDIGKELAYYSSSQVAEKLGLDVIKEVIGAVLTGENIRNLTEQLTRRRLTVSNAAMFTTFIKASSQIPNFIEEFPHNVKEEANLSQSNKGCKAFMNWMIGLNQKSIQNVLRNNKRESLDTYLSEYKKSITDIASSGLGDISGDLQLDNNSVRINWDFILYLLSAVGTQTLAIRGSEKSMYGKMFEKLILGSLLQILDFTLVAPNENTDKEGIFWLSHREDKRESDATLLYKLGKGVKFDIGFIGPGNSEISLDKVSRFEKDLEVNSKKYSVHTIIIVDRLGDNSRVAELAKKINGSLVQMSMSYWVQDVAKLLSESVGFSHPLIDMSQEEGLDYIQSKLRGVDISKLIS